jgi:hypothetical protein
LVMHKGVLEVPLPCNREIYKMNSQYLSFPEDPLVSSLN